MHDIVSHPEGCDALFRTQFDSVVYSISCLLAPEESLKRYHQGRRYPCGMTISAPPFQLRPGRPDDALAILEGLCTYAEGPPFMSWRSMGVQQSLISKTLHIGERPPFSFVWSPLYFRTLNAETG